MDEPRRHPWYLILLALCVLGTSPFLFVGSDSSRVLGLPIWLWWSLLFTCALALVTGLGILLLWKEDADD